MLSFIVIINMIIVYKPRLWSRLKVFSSFSRNWRLNERMYGALQGLNKSETAAKFGEDQVKVRLINIDFL